MHGSLRKVHSMDVDPKARENPPLIHSVSIVVELAAMEQPQARQEPEAAHQPEVDDDDEDSESVSTDLARKVVLVDEADKILRSRAQSAEPRFDLDTGGARIPTGKPPVPLRLAEHQCQQRQSQAGLTTTCGGSSSSGELAERGELSKLGMRRFTHHQVNFSPFATHSDAPLAAGAVADQVRRLADSSGAEGNLFSASSHKQQAGSLVKSWQQRRQSLQISLLTGSSSPSKSLTEEEFRGEREFNEQVRNSRSPEIAGLALAQQQPPLRLRGPSDGPEVLGNFRCKSATTSEDATWTPKPHSIVKSCQQQQDRPSSSSGQRRRVSFSSIDPVLVSRGNLAKSRASFAFFPEPARQASGALSDSNQAGKPAGAPASKLETQTGQLHKRHSNATSASRPSRGQVKELVQEQQGRRCSAATWRAPNQARSMASREQDTGSAGHRCEQAATGASQRVACKSQEFSSSAAKATRPDTGEQSASTCLVHSADRSGKVAEDSMVQSIMANARLRQEEFARLLEEHEQIVNEINRVETKISGSQTGGFGQQKPVVGSVASPQSQHQFSTAGQQQQQLQQQQVRKQ